MPLPGPASQGPGNGEVLALLADVGKNWPGQDWPETAGPRAAGEPERAPVPFLSGARVGRTTLRCPTWNSPVAAQPPPSTPATPIQADTEQAM
jgi:hypothetical protein